MHQLLGERSAIRQASADALGGFLGGPMGSGRMPRFFLQQSRHAPYQGAPSSLAERPPGKAGSKLQRRGRTGLRRGFSVKSIRAAIAAQPQNPTQQKDNMHRQKGALPKI